MAMRVNPKWLAEETAKFTSANQQGHIHSVNLGFALGIKELILNLADRNVPFKIVNLGGGVKRITTDVSVCPKCNGTGKC